MGRAIREWPGSMIDLEQIERAREDCMARLHGKKRMISLRFIPLYHERKNI